MDWKHLSSDRRAAAAGRHIKRDMDELPWQVIFVGDVDMLNRLRRSSRGHAQQVRHALMQGGLGERPHSPGWSWLVAAVKRIWLTKRHMIGIPSVTS